MFHYIKTDAYVFIYVLFIFNFFACTFHLAFSYFLIYDCFLYSNKNYFISYFFL